MKHFLKNSMKHRSFGFKSGLMTVIALVWAIGIQAQTDEVDVYVFGSKGNGINADAGYWKNGTWESFGTGYNGAVIQAVVEENDLYTLRYFGNDLSVVYKNGVEHLRYENVEGLRIAVANGNVYAVERTASPIVPSYWKNSEIIPIEVPKYYSSFYDTVISYPTVIFYDIAADGNDVFIAGCYGVTYTGTGMYFYWKNGVCQIGLAEDYYYNPGSMKFFSPDSWGEEYRWIDRNSEGIAISDGKTYMLGYVYTENCMSENARRYLAYWQRDIDGITDHIIKVEDNITLYLGYESLRKEKSGELRTITVVNGDIHITGCVYDYSLTPAVHHAFYWKNGQKTIFAESTNLLYAPLPSETQIVGNDVYIYGSFNGERVLWMNGEIIYTFNYTNGENSTCFAVVPRTIPASTDATLSNLAVSSGSLTPAFNSTHYNYTVNVANSVSSITITATPNNPNATLSGDTGRHTLIVGANPFTITVTAEDDTTIQNYTVTVTRANSGSGISETTMGEINIYPNPTTGQLTINNEQLTINNVEIYDIYGRNVHSFTRSLVHSINISHFPSGIYFVKIQTELGEVVKKVVKE